MSEPATLYCAYHPNTETLLRCNKCEKPICPKCAVQTPVGFRCKECVRSQQSVYFTAESKDYPITFGVSLLVALIATPIIGYITGFVPLFLGLFISFMGGSAAGGVLSQIIRKAVNKRRGRYLAWFMILGVVLGILIGSIVGFFFFGNISVLNPVFLIFTGATVFSAYQFLR